MSVSLTLRRDKSMALLFATEEFSERQHRTIERLKNRRLDGLLMFRQQSMY